MSAATVLTLASTATVATADAALYRGATTEAGQEVSVTVRTRADGTARIVTGRGGFPVACANGQRIRSELDVRVRLSTSGWFDRRRTVKLATMVTGRAKARERYRGRLGGKTGTLTHTVRITGSKTTCRATLRWTLSER